MVDAILYNSKTGEKICFAQLVDAPGMLETFDLQDYPKLHDTTEVIVRRRRMVAAARPEYSPPYIHLEVDLLS